MNKLTSQRVSSRLSQLGVVLLLPAQYLTASSAAEHQTGTESEPSPRGLQRPAPAPMSNAKYKKP